MCTCKSTIYEAKSRGLFHSVHFFDLGCNRAEIKSRFSLPFAVSNPFSMENGSAWI